MATKREIAAYRAFRRSVVFLPEGIAQHSYSRATTIVVRSRYQASGSWAKPQSVKEIAAHPHAVNQVHFAALREIETVLAPSENVRENILLIAQLLPQRVRSEERRVGKEGRYQCR